MSEERKHHNDLDETFTSLNYKAIAYAWDPDAGTDKRLPISLIVDELTRIEELITGVTHWIKFIVTDGTSPVDNVQITLVNTGVTGTTYIQNTNSSGITTFVDLPNGSYEYTTEILSHSPATGIVKIMGSNETVEISLSLVNTDTVDIRFYAINEASEPLENVVISMTEGGFTGYTDSNGYLILYDVPDTNSGEYVATLANYLITNGTCNMSIVDAISGFVEETVRMESSITFTLTSKYEGIGGTDDQLLRDQKFKLSYEGVDVQTKTTNPSGVAVFDGLEKNKTYQLNIVESNSEVYTYTQSDVIIVESNVVDSVYVEYIPLTAQPLSNQTIIGTQDVTILVQLDRGFVPKETTGSFVLFPDSIGVVTLLKGETPEVITDYTYIEEDDIISITRSFDSTTSVTIIIDETVGISTSILGSSSITASMIVTLNSATPIYIGAFKFLNNTTTDPIPIAMSANSCTFDSATNTVEDSDHIVVQNSRINFYNYNSSVLPDEISTTITYYAVEVESTSFKVSLSKNGDAIEFTTEGIGSTSYKHALWASSYFYDFPASSIQYLGVYNPISVDFELLDTEGFEYTSPTEVFLPYVAIPANEGWAEFNAYATTFGIWNSMTNLFDTYNEIDLNNDGNLYTIFVRKVIGGGTSGYTGEAIYSKIYMQES